MPTQPTNSTFNAYLNSPIGWLGIRCDAQSLTQIQFLSAADLPDLPNKKTCTVGTITLLTTSKAPQHEADVDSQSCSPHKRPTQAKSNNAITSSLMQHICEQFNAYFIDPNHTFTLPTLITGTAFQERVWSLMRAIPCGQTRTYGDVAKQLQSCAQAVGNACRANPFPIITPCHRIVAKAGIGGFGGATDGELLTIKRRLIEHELKYNQLINR